MTGIHEVTPAYPVVKEFLDRKKLAELGYVTSINDLDAYQAEVMVVVADEMIRAEQEVMPKLKARAKGGGSSNRPTT